MRHDPASAAVMVMLRSVRMYGMARAAGDLIERGAPAFDTALPILSQLLKAEIAEREVRSVACRMKAARFPACKVPAGFDPASGEVNETMVRRVVEEYTSDWPDTIKIGYTLDKSRFIFEVLGLLQSAIITATALVMIVVAAFGMRSALLVGIAIPTSFMIGFLLVGLLGIIVNMMVMFGLVLTVGMLVDGAIVIVEYDDRKMAEGLERRQAYTLAAFLPMLMWPGMAGEFMNYLPIMVIIVLSGALVTAMIFLPALGGMIGKTYKRAKDVANAQRVAGTSEFDRSKLAGLTGLYVRMLARIIHHPVKVIAVAIAVAIDHFCSLWRI